MEKRTLTSVLALTFLMAGTATFAMEDTEFDTEYTESSHPTFTLSKDFSKNTNIIIRSTEKNLDEELKNKELKAVFSKENNRIILVLVRKELKESTPTLLSVQTSELLETKDTSTKKSWTLNPLTGFGMFSYGSQKTSNTSTVEKEEEVTSINKTLSQTKIDTLDVEGISPLQIGVTEVVEPIPLKFTKGKAVEYAEKEGVITITTDNNANATYQATTDRMKVTPGEKFKIPYEITVEKGGKMSFGVLNTQRNSWIDREVMLLTPGFHKGIKEVTIPQGESEISLVLRNCHLISNGGPGQSTFTAKLGLEKVAVISKSNISDSVNTSQVDIIPSIPLINSNKIEEPIKLTETPKKKSRGFFSWFFSKKEEVVTQKDVNELPSADAYFKTALKMKESNTAHFDLLMKCAKATSKEGIPGEATDAISTLLKLGRSFKDDVKSFANVVLTEDEILLESFVKNLRNAYLRRLEKAVEKTVEVNIFENKPTESFIFSIPKDILEIKEEKN